MGLDGKLRRIWWHLRRPKELEGLLRQIRHSFFGIPNSYWAPARQRELALRWGEARCLTPAESFTAVTGQPAPEPIDYFYPTGKPAPEPNDQPFFEVFERANQIEHDCPIQDMGGRGQLNLMYWLAEHCQAKYVVETGVAYGMSSLAFLLSLQNRPDAKLYSSELFVDDFRTAQLGCVVPEQLRNQWEMFVSNDQEAIPEVLDKVPYIDICHYDSDKTYDGRMWASPILWEALRPGGFFIMDDINDNLAFREFCLDVNVDPIVVNWGKLIGIAQKPG